MLAQRTEGLRVATEQLLRRVEVVHTNRYELGVELGVGRMEGVYGVYDIWYGVWYVWYMVWYMVFMGMIVIV